MSEQQTLVTSQPGPIAENRPSPEARRHGLVRLLKAVNDWIVVILEAPFKYLFGRDIFISYARVDAANYAQQLAIDLRGRNPKFSFYLDQWASLSGTKLPPSLNRALRWSHLLVLIGSEQSLASHNVRLELEVFFKQQGRFVPIDVDGVLHRAMQKDEFLAAICGPGAVMETAKNLASSKPSDAVITRVANAADFTRQDQRLRRAVKRTTLGVLAVIVLAYVVSQQIVADTKSQAAVAVSTANQQVTTAEQQQEQALLKVGEAAFASSNAKADQVVADILAGEAREEAQQAELKRQGAERLRTQAQAEARKQGEIAISRQRANQAEFTLRQQPDRLTQSVSLAVESMSRADALGIHALEADTALRGSLSLLPRSLGSRTIPGDITAVALSPDPKYLAALSQTTVSGDSSSVLRIQRLADGKEIVTFPREGSLLALSNDARRVSISDGRTIHTWDVSGEGKWDFEIENSDDSLSGMALTPDGKYLALALRNADAEEHEGFAEVWNVETKKRVTRLDTGYIVMESISFSGNGRLLAIGGIGIGPRGKRMGRALVWDISYPREDGKLTDDDFREPLELLQNEPISTIAPGIDNRYLATAGQKMALVWRKTNRSGYQEIARMPVEHGIDSLAFGSDGRTLSILSASTCKKTSTPCGDPGRILEDWQSAGYWEAVNAPHAARIEALAFRPGDESITTVSDNYGEDKIRVWSARDGAEVKSANLRFDDKSADVEGLTSDVRYVAQKNESEWYVWDVVGQRSFPVRSEVDFEKEGNPALSADGSLLALTGKKRGTNQNAISSYRFDGAAYAPARTFPLAAFAVELSASPGGRYVAAQYYEKGLQVFDVRSGRDVTPSAAKGLTDVESFQFGPNDECLAILSTQGKTQTLRLWRIREDREIGTPLVSTKGISSYNFSPAGNHLVASYGNDTMNLLNIRTGRMRSLSSSGSVSITAFSADERFLATADDVGLVRVIELFSGDEVAHLQHDAVVTTVAFSKNGKYLATATEAADPDYTPEDEQYVLHVWLLRPRDLINEACQRLERLSGSNGQLSYCKVTSAKAGR